MLLKAGADPNVTDGEGNTPLHKCELGEMAAALLQAGGDPNTANQVRRGSQAVMRVVLRHGAGVYACAATNAFNTPPPSHRTYRPG